MRPARGTRFQSLELNPSNSNGSKYLHYGVLKGTEVIDILINPVPFIRYYYVN